MEFSLNANSLKGLSLFYEKLELQKLLNFFQANIEWLKIRTGDMSKESEKIQNKSNEITKELNLLKQRLDLANKEWEKWKTKLIQFKNYEGILREAICKNTKNTKQELCKVKKLKEK